VCPRLAAICLSLSPPRSLCGPTKTALLFTVLLPSNPPLSRQSGAVCNGVSPAARLLAISDSDVDRETRCVRLSRATFVTCNPVRHLNFAFSTNCVCARARVWLQSCRGTAFEVLKLRLEEHMTQRDAQGHCPFEAHHNTHSRGPARQPRGLHALPDATSAHSYAPHCRARMPSTFCRELRSRAPRPGSTPQRCESATRAFLHTRTQCCPNPLLAVHSLQGLGTGRTKPQPPRARPRVVTDLTARRRHGRKRPHPRHARAPPANPPLPHATCHNTASTREADARGRQTRTIAAQADVTCSQFPSGCTNAGSSPAVVLHGPDTPTALRVQTRARLTPIANGGQPDRSDELLKRRIRSGGARQRSLPCLLLRPPARWARCAASSSDKNILRRTGLNHHLARRPTPPAPHATAQPGTPAYRACVSSRCTPRPPTRHHPGVYKA
jgi:hypothetical protein